MSVLNALICPLDKHPLTLKDRSFVCLSGHSFDLAKSGYINLLPVQNKRSKDPGDSKEMVASRRDFLALDHYQPIAETITSYLLAQDVFNRDICLLDAGCGDGYYLNHIKQNCTSNGKYLDVMGLDISKWAITTASKSNKFIHWVVGSNAHIPTASECFDVVTCLFGFPIFSEFSRVLKPTGRLLMVDVGADHLIELRRILYPKIHDYEDGYSKGVEGFSLVEEQALTFPFLLSSQAHIQNLLSMTPHIHKAPYEGKKALEQIESLELTADVKLRWYIKNTEIIENNND
ncbi:putative RNA methyltransferase [Marinomonas sp. 2405UD68-3]|uniref:putative RNA methyltransferase n=1 Tax=Marinomonas sp. 2405UD68-3 TaxID=3391835 RepID=UPI0039C943FC